MKERLIELPKMMDKRGNLSFAESNDQVPFNIVRAYWLYDVPGGEIRGSHAYKNQEEVIFALSGSFDVVLDDGTAESRYTLNRANVGLYVPKMKWRKLENFTTNSLCLVLASMPYNEDEYIRNYKKFKAYLKSESEEEKYLAAFPKKRIHHEDESNADYTVFDCNLYELPIVKHRSGNITAIHSSENIPFDIERIFYVYDIPSGEMRGAHAHRYCHELLIAASGSFDVELDDGVRKRVVTLNNPMTGLHLPPGVWAVEKNYSSGAICLVLTSQKYTEEDYIRKYADFKEFRSDGNKKI